MHAGDKPLRIPPAPFPKIARCFRERAQIFASPPPWGRIPRTVGWAARAAVPKAEASSTAPLAAARARTPEQFGDQAAVVEALARVRVCEGADERLSPDFRTPAPLGPDFPVPPTAHYGVLTVPSAPSRAHIRERTGCARVRAADFRIRAPLGRISPYGPERGGFNGFRDQPETRVASRPRVRGREGALPAVREGRGSRSGPSALRAFLCLVADRLPDGPVRRVPLADVVYEDRWGQAYRLL